MLRLKREIRKVPHREESHSLPFCAETGLGLGELTDILECLSWFTWKEAWEAQARVRQSLSNVCVFCLLCPISRQGHGINLGFEVDSTSCPPKNPTPKPKTLFNSGITSTQSYASSDTYLSLGG